MLFISQAEVTNTAPMGGQTFDTEPQNCGNSPQSFVHDENCDEFVNTATCDEFINTATFDEVGQAEKTNHNPLEATKSRLTKSKARRGKAQNHEMDSKNVTDEKSSQNGYFSFDKAEFRAWKDKFKGRTMDTPMKSTGARRTLTLQHCKKSEHREFRVEEWFGSFLEAKKRAKALNPQGAFKLEQRKDKDKGEDGDRLSYICPERGCHAHYTLKVVDPDKDGNRFGIYGLVMMNSIVKLRK